MRSLPVSDELESGIIKIMSDCGKNITPFMKLFWDEQKRLASDHPTQRRFHPVIIRYCLSVLQDSAKAYEKWRKNTFLILPNSRILSDYKNVIHPKRGFNGGHFMHLNIVSLVTVARMGTQTKTWSCA